MSDEVVMYYNPACSKCAYALSFLQERGITPRLLFYLEQAPAHEDLRTLVSGLGLRPFDLVRTSEPLYAQQFEGRTLTDDEWIDALVEFPVLLQRPLLVKGGQAVVGRTQAQLEQWLGQT